MNIHEQSASIEILVGEIANQKKISTEERDHRISQLRQSSIIQESDSSFKVITSLANTMIGSSAIVYPVLFVKDGMVGSLLIMLLVGVAQYFTCRLLIVHNRPDEPDFNAQVKRILGVKWARFNNYVNVLLLFFVCIAYFLFISSNFYQITGAIISEIRSSETALPKEDSIHFDVYSIQYAAIICMFFTAPLICKREIEIIMKLFKITVYFVMAYFIFILVQVINVLATPGAFDFSLYHKFDPDFSSVAGTFALSFLIHPIAGPILKRNAKQENNSRDLFLGYCLTAVIYSYIGFVGGLACAESVNDIYENESQYSSIFNCIKKDNAPVIYVIGKIVQLGILFQNLSVMPILSFITRKQFTELMQTQKSKQIGYYVYNSALILLCLIISIFTIDVSIVLSFDGAIIGFFMGFGIPIYTHLKCYHAEYFHKTQTRSIAENLQSLETEGASIEDMDEETRELLTKCNEHPKSNALKHFLIYGALAAFGVALGVFRIVAFVSSF